MIKLTTGIIAFILLISLLLIGITTASVLTDSNSAFTQETNLNRITVEVLDDITSYIQIRDQKGKFCEIDGVKKIDKIAILISPMVTHEISLSKLTIQLDNGENVNLLTYSTFAETLDQNSVFEHGIWDKLNGKNFGFISIYDSDNSLKDYDTVNDFSDNAYIVFRLPPNMMLAKHDKIIVTLFPSTGMKKVIELEAPLPIKSVVTFE